MSCADESRRILNYYYGDLSFDNIPSQFNIRPIDTMNGILGVHYVASEISLLYQNDNVRFDQSRNVLLGRATLFPFGKGEQGGQRGPTDDETA
jgi:hypothetical protein